MIIKHRRKITPYPPLLIAIVLGQDATKCDKIGRVSSEPILVSIVSLLFIGNLSTKNGISWKNITKKGY